MTAISGTGGIAANDAVPARTASARMMAYFGYGAGSFGACAALFPTGSLILYFLTDTIGLSVALATIAISVPKIWDILFDPAIGAIADRQSREKGNRFGVFVLAAFGLPAMAASSFVVAWSPSVVTTICVTLLLIGVSTTYTIYWVTHLAAANDLEQAGLGNRNRLLVARMIGQSGGGLLAGALAPLLLSMTTGFGRYAIMAGTLAIIGVVAMLVCALLLKYTRTPPEESATEKLNFFVACRAAMVRPRALGLILSNFMVMMACTFMGSVLPFVNKYVLGLGDAYMSYLFTALMGAQVAGAATGAWVAERFGLSRGFMLSSIGMLLAGLAMYPAASSLIALAIALIGWGGATGAYTVLLHSSMLEASKGRIAGVVGSTGLLLGLLFATGKIGDTAGSLITAWSLSAAGGVKSFSGSVSAVHTFQLWFGIAPSLLMLAAIILTIVADRFTAPASAVKSAS
ncbi:MAG: MFS transporter [Sphingopyxis sp.]|nr:MFS transporter [Sphingopyxis sp.]